MARQYGRLGSILVAVVILLIILANLNTFSSPASTVGIPKEPEREGAQQNDGEAQSSKPKLQNPSEDGEEQPPKRPVTIDPDKAIPVGVTEKEIGTPSKTNSSSDPTSTLSKIIVMGKLSKQD